MFIFQIFFFKGPKSFLWKSLADFCVFFLACNQKMFTCNILHLIISWEKNVQIFVSLAQNSYAQKTSFYWNFASRPKRKSSPKKLSCYITNFFQRPKKRSLKSVSVRVFQRALFWVFEKRSLRTLALTEFSKSALQRPKKALSQKSALWNL